jgi:methylenetetrahydrofolate dehydrogenase (NADP+)/methenyltetrahydrofolate cyclohydrolase
MTLIDGKAVAKATRARVAEEVADLKMQGVSAGLAVIIVGEDPASQVYVRNKERACAQCGIMSEKYALPAATTQTELLALIDRLNDREDISGILCQMPLPRHIDPQTVIHAIRPDKDVDAFHPENVGRIMTGEPGFAPCTPAGVMTLLDHYGIAIQGKRCVVVGRSNIVGKPMAMLLLHRSATVTICHSKTVDLPAVCRDADILVAAIGKPRFITADFVKDGAVVIDVGMNRLPDGVLCGDVDFDGVAPKCSYITPVPGGVGPMTIATLMANTVLAAKIQAGQAAF